MTCQLELFLQEGELMEEQDRNIQLWNLQSFVFFFFFSAAQKIEKGRSSSHQCLAYKPFNPKIA